MGLKARISFISQNFSFYEQLKFDAQLRSACKKFAKINDRLSHDKAQIIFELRVYIEGYDQGKVKSNPCIQMNSSIWLSTIKHGIIHCTYQEVTG